MSKPEAAALAQPDSELRLSLFVTKALMFGLAVLIAALISMISMPPLAEAVVLFVGAHLAAWLLISGITGFEGTALAPYFLLLAAAWLLAWRCVAVLSALAPDRESGAGCSAPDHPGDLRRLDPDHLGSGDARRRHSLHPAAAAERDRRAHRQFAADARRRCPADHLQGGALRLCRRLRRRLPRRDPGRPRAVPAPRPACRSATWSRRCRSSASRRSW